MKTPISVQDAETIHGMSCFHEKMENGEFRFRLRSSDGTAYIRTVAGDSAAWQKSHFHKIVRETYIVQAGWIAMASIRQGNFSISRFTEGDIFTTEPLVHHNIYMPRSSITHTVKHGRGDADDWWESLTLDRILKEANQKELEKLLES